MTLLLFGLFFLFMLLDVPIAFAIGASTLYALYQSGVPLMVVTQQMFQGINSFALVAIPMFILAGDLMAQGKVSERLVSFADSLVGFMRGGLSVVSVMAASWMRHSLTMRAAGRMPLFSFKRASFLGKPMINCPLEIPSAQSCFGIQKTSARPILPCCSLVTTRNQGEQ